jgi:hypothetical protein
LLETEVVFFVVGAGLFVLTFGFLFARIVSLNRTFEALAKQRSWEVEVSLFSFPRLRFKHRDFRGLLSGDFGGQNRRASTYLSIHPPKGWDFSLTVQSRDFLTWLSGQIGRREIQTGHPEFDRDLFVTGKPKETCRRILDAKTRHLIAEVRSVAPEARLKITANWQEFLVEIGTAFLSHEGLDRFATAALALFDRVHNVLVTLEGIEFIDTSEELATPLCQVCGEALSEDVIYCRSCHTPHHRDCWKYNRRRCSTFGCGGRRFTKKKKKKKKGSRK